MNSRRLVSVLAVALVVGLMAAIVACAVNPATGKRHISLISESEEVQMGQQSDREVVQAMGRYPNPPLEDYVSRVGHTLASKSERPDLPWEFKVVDDDAINAFALPGGYIYVTRGILAYLSSEAELAGVLGHEIGHVTARHSVNQMSKQQLYGGIFGVASAVSSSYGYGAVSDLINLGGGLLFLRFSRDDEKQSDELGIRYMVRAGYDPRPLGEVMEMLEETSQAAGGGKVPGWMSTHPAPENRKGLIDQQLAGQQVPPPGAKHNRDAYLDAIDGIVHGENPREGYFKGKSFYHPDMKFRVDFPEGWKTVNTRSAVVGISQGEDAILQVTGTPKSTARAAADAFFGQEGVAGGSDWKTEFNGLTGVSRQFKAATQQGEIQGMVAFIELDEIVLKITGMTSPDLWSERKDAVLGSMASFGRLTDREALDVEPARLRVVMVGRARSLEEVASEYDATVPVEVLGRMNDLRPGDTVQPGTRLKLVVGGKLP